MAPTLLPVTSRGIAGLLIVALIAVACTDKEDPVDARPIDGSTETSVAVPPNSLTTPVSTSHYSKR